MERPEQNEQQIAALIEQGGSVATKEAGQGSGAKKVQLRVPLPLLTQIDQSLAKRGMLSPSRHSWLLEACIEKLEREETG